jgi:hypothetical protein
MAGVTEVTDEIHRTRPPQEAALRRLIATECQALDHALHRLGERFQETIDWRRHASRHRGALWAAASGAALLGLWRRRRRRSPAERAAAAVVESARDVSAQACETLATLGSLISVRRRIPNVVVAPLAAAATRAAMRWWDGRRTGAPTRRPARDRAHEEGRWRLERRMS